MTTRPNPAVPITARTGLVGLLGHPVGHSLSPRFQNAALAAAGIDARYLAFDVSSEAVAEALKGARALGFLGLNVTVPHKEQALGLADEADPQAAASGAANTLVPVSAGWKAYNTDIHGLLTALAEELAFIPRGRRCLLLGAGGAARAAAVGLFGAGAQEILVTNRNDSRAEKLVTDLSRSAGSIRVRRIPLGAALSEVGAGDLLVSATPLGLDPAGSWPWPVACFPPGLVVYDLAYRGDAETALVAAARAAGHRAASGRRMLLHQGVRAFELWFGVKPDLGVAEAALFGTRP